MTMIRRSASWISVVIALAALSWFSAASVLGQERHELVQLLSDFDQEPVFWRQLDIARQIVERGNGDVLPGLQRWLDHEDRHIRGNAAFIFAGLDDPQGFQVLYSILDDRSERSLGQGIPGIAGNIDVDGWWIAAQIKADRYYAVHLLGELRDPRAVDELLPLLTDEEVAYKVAWALGEIRDERAIPHLISVLDSPDALVRTIAIHSLAKLGAVEARPNIEALLSDAALPNAGDQVPVGESARAALEILEEEPE